MWQPWWRAIYLAAPLIVLFSIALSARAQAGYDEPAVCAALPALAGDVTSSAGSCTTAIGNVPAAATINVGAIYSNQHVATQEGGGTTGSCHTAASSVTLTLCAGLSQALTAGKTYYLDAHLIVTTGISTAGAKCGFISDGTLTATSVNYSVVSTSSTSVVAANATALPATSGGNGGTSTVVAIDMRGAIVVNVGGTISVACAQNVTQTTKTEFLINSTFQAVRVN